MTLFQFKTAISDAACCRQDNLREKTFLEHYSWLRDAALIITHGERERSEDLVHDAFLQFLEKDPETTSVADIRGYLYGMLRNLHLLQLRRATRRPVQQLSLLDYDSAPVALNTWTSAEQLHCTDLLVRACDFACYRKEVALTASILILRFFHGYYPGEIAELLRAKRRAVDQWIQRGRIETKQYVESPYPLPKSNGPECKILSVVGSTAFLRLLRERIFTSCATDCGILGVNPKELGVRELAHLVSCRACLDRRSLKMGLAHVAERMADDISDKDDGRSQDDGRPQSRSGGGGKISPLRAGSKSQAHNILRQVHARRKQRFEHRPREISLAFDGQLRATLLVNSATNTLNLSLDSREMPHSVAVLSEQEFNFLLLDHDDLTCRERRVHRLSLSDERFLEVAVTPETLGPSIQVVYEDPLFFALTSDAEDDEPERITAEAPILMFPSGRAESTLASGPAGREAWLEKCRSYLRAANPLFTGAIGLGAIAVLCVVFWLRSDRSLSPGEFLGHAQKGERTAFAAERPGIIRQKVAIRTPRRSIERTIYRDAQGVRKPRPQRLSPEDQELKNTLASANVSWEAPLSATEYADWRYRAGATRDLVTRPGPHLLMLTTTPVSAGAVLSESLTIRDTDLHPVKRRVDLRDAGVIEVAELNYDVLPWGAADSQFERPYLPKMGRPSPGVFHSPADAAETELAVRYALHGAGADLGEPIDIHAGTGSISVVGIIASAERKQELLAALKDIPHVTARLQTEEEAGATTLQAPIAGAVRDIVAVRSPIDKELLEHFGDSAAVENFSKRAIAVTGDLMSHAWALRHLSERFGEAGSRDEVAWSASSRQLLQAMRHDHRRAISEATSELANLLRPVLRSMVPAVPEPAPATKIPLFESVQEVQRLTLYLVSGSGTPNTNELVEPAAAQDLLAALRRLETILEE